MTYPGVAYTFDRETGELMNICPLPSVIQDAGMDTPRAV